MGGQHALYDQPDAGMPRAFGKYTLLSRLATGGMADVFVALLRADFGFEKLVVIKCLLPSLAADQRHVAMFLDEARTAATLSHPNIVQMFDAGEVDGTYYIAMEFIEGQDLRSLMRRLHDRGQIGLPLDHAIFVLTRLLSGLEYAHQKRDFHGNPLRIVHRDISPQNVVITFSGDVKIVDFGVAKSAMQLGEKTEVGQLKGKVAYMSPEQARGQPIDWRSDLFSAGVVLFELTTGTRLFRGNNEVETLRRIYTAEHPRPSQVKPDFPVELEAIVMRALARDRRSRYQSAREMQTELLQFARSFGITTTEAAFQHWLEAHVRDARDQQEHLLGRVRELAAAVSQRRAPSDRPSPTSMPPAPMVPVATLRTRLRTSDPPPPSSSRDARPSEPAQPSASSQPPAERSSSAPDPRLDPGRTLRASAHSVPPPASGTFRKPSPLRRALWALLVLATLAVLVSLAGSRAAGSASSPAVRHIHARVSALIIAPLRRSWRALVRDDRAPVSGVEVRSSIAGVALWLDGKPVKNGQLVTTLMPGSRHRLRGAAPGHAVRDVDFVVKPGKQVVTVKLDALPPPPAL
jgi:serine/threonine-protein kinase